MSGGLRARVKGGRLVLDEPSSLPDGTEVELIPVDEDLGAEGRVRLHRFLSESLRDHVPGTGIPADEIIARVRARH
ncbi:MAG: hypothetical protein KIT72_09030 [Polyangiaceae bacterium]|nr:hypothetical protein [Polyangiaceae bacterium]MCW5790552.1 hypothetical protein [Polyangiaceae bacterium]